jgi:hypothetical protein
MGKDDEEIKKPSPITPGAVASQMASSFLAGLIVRPLALPDPPKLPDGSPGPSHGYGGMLSTALMNGLVGAAFDSVYGRSVGPAIEDAVNGAVGIPAAERKPETFTLERLMRTIARSAVSGAAYYMVDGATQGMFASLGAQIGGPIGAIAAMAGPALLGLTAGTIVDKAVGGAVGSMAGSMFSAVTGLPKSEDRPAPAPEAPPEGEAPADAAAAQAAAPPPAAAPAVVAAPASAAAPAPAKVMAPAPRKARKSGAKRAGRPHQTRRQRAAS